MRERQKTSSRPDSRSPGQIWVATIFRGWDLWVALAIGLGVAAISLASGQLTGGAGFYWPLAALTFCLAVGVWAVERWLADRLRSSDYGELLGMADPDYRAAMAPYFVVEVVGFFAALSAVLTAVVIEGLEAGGSRALFHGVTAWLVSWSLLGLLSLFILTNKHMRREAAVENMKRERAAAKRDRPLNPQRNDAS